MSSPVSAGFSLMFQSIREGIRNYLPASSTQTWDVLESSSILQITSATLKNLPYISYAKEFRIDDICHVISSRVTFIEASLMILVSLVHHLFFAVFYTGLILIPPIGFSENIRASCRMHWSQIAYSCVSLGIGLVGVVVPYYGVGINVLFLNATWNSLIENYDRDVNLFERPLVLEIQKIFEKNSAFIYNSFRVRINDEWRYKSYYKPSLEHIEKRLYSAKRMNDLISLVVDIKTQWPQVGFSVIPSVSDASAAKLGSPAAHDHYV